MKFYENYLMSKGYDLIYIDSENPLSDIRKLIPYIAEQEVNEIHYCDVSDDWL